MITDEARHVHYGVARAAQVLPRGLAERERSEREDWAFEMSLLLRNRFLAHEFYDEFYAHRMTRRAWDELMLQRDLMGLFRRTMFRRIVPNLKRIGLLSDAHPPALRVARPARVRARAGGQRADGQGAARRRVRRGRPRAARGRPRRPRGEISRWTERRPRARRRTASGCRRSRRCRRRAT